MFPSSVSKIRKPSDPVIHNQNDWNTYMQVGRVINPYRQIRPEGFKPSIFFNNIRVYGAPLAQAAIRKTEEFINLHPKLKSRLDVLDVKAKDASQKVSGLAKIAAQNVMYHVEQSLSKYLEAKEKEESIDEYASGPMALGIDYLSILVETIIDPSDKQIRKSAFKLLLDRANLSKRPRKFLDGQSKISDDDTELIDVFLKLTFRHRTTVLKRSSPFFGEAIDMAYKVREGTIKRSAIPEEEFAIISDIFENTRRKNLRFKISFLPESNSLGDDKSIENDDLIQNSIQTLNVESGTKLLLKDSADIVETLLTHSSWFVRATLAGNPHISEETAKILMEDENPIVRGIISKRFTALEMPALAF